jgi:hypothetical protein
MGREKTLSPVLTAKPTRMEHLPGERHRAALQKKIISEGYGSLRAA